MICGRKIIIKRLKYGKETGPTIFKEDERILFYYYVGYIFRYPFYIFNYYCLFHFTTSSENPVENEKYRDYAGPHKARLLEKLKDELIRDGLEHNKY